MQRFHSPLLTRSVVAAAISLSILGSASSASAAGSRANVQLQSKAVTVQGTVLSDNSARRTVVVALHSGLVRTLRFSSPRHVAIGTQISSHASRLGDGTYRATTLQVRAKTRSAHLRATVAANRGRRLELSSGASVFFVTRSRISSHDSSSNPPIGEVVNVNVDVVNGALDETSLQAVGVSGMIDLQGALSALSSTSLTINVNEGASTTVAIPSSITLPSTIAVGDQVELMVAYANQSFSLVTIVDDQSAANNNSTGVSGSDQNQNSTIDVEGLIVSTDATSLTIQPGDNAASVVVAIPSTMTLAPLVAGERVHAVAGMVAGVLTLLSLDVQGPEGDQGQSITTEAEGQVVSVSPTSLVIQPSDQSTSISFVVPTSLDVSTIVVGDQVQAKGVLSGNALTLTEFEIQD